LGTAVAEILGSGHSFSSGSGKKIAPAIKKPRQSRGRIIASSSLVLPTTSTNTRPLAIRFTQAFYCALDGRVRSGNRRRLLRNEPVRHGDLRTQNGILRQVSLVVHRQFSPFAVEPRTTLLQDRSVRGEGGFGCACRISGTGLPIPACLRAKIFFLGRAGIDDLAP
jgi:hypothetical protein